MRDSQPNNAMQYRSSNYNSLIQLVNSAVILFNIAIKHIKSTAV
jgi:hypothetical protein